MKTTKKEFYEKVQKHIAERLNDEETTDRTEQLRQVVEEFNDWWCPYEKRRNPNRQNAFIDWLHGLPSCLSIDFYYYDQRQRLQEWHNQTEAEASKYSDDVINASYCYLIYREFCKMCKAVGIDF
jgi:hypothetical protein